MFLITGTGRSGTGWAASFFTSLGMSCSHEGVYGPKNKSRIGERAESSWLAIPFLDEIDVPIIRVVKDPYEVVQSIMRRNFLASGYRKTSDQVTKVYDDFVKSHRPDIFEAKDYLGAAIRYAATWDESLDYRDHHVLKIDDKRPSQLNKAIEYVGGTKLSSSSIKSHLKKVGFVNMDINDSLVVSHDEIKAHPDGALVEYRADRLGL